MSSNITIPTQVPYGEYTLRDLFDLHSEEVLTLTNCHHIGTISSFDPSTQVATATINYKRTLFVQNPSTNQYAPNYVDYPPVSGPLIVLGGGSTSLTFPVAAGDFCLVLFNDRDFDTWFQSQAGQPLAPVPTARIHSFSDAIILVGLRSLANPISNYDTTRAVLQNGTTMVGVGASKVKVANASTTLGTAMDTLMTDLSSLATALQGNPSVESAAAAAGSALSTAVTSLKTTLDSLLE